VAVPRRSDWIYLEIQAEVCSFQPLVDVRIALVNERTTNRGRDKEECAKPGLRTPRSVQGNCEMAASLTMKEMLVK